MLISSIESPVILEIVSLSRPKPIAFLAFAKAFSFKLYPLGCGGWEVTLNNIK